jgi:2-C-methyl-D-erythritol 4-phosphate cytidylyltransferase
MRKYVIIVAAGSGSRMGGDVPKQYLLLNGLPVLMHTVQAFYEYDPRMQIILVLAADQRGLWNELCQKYHFTVQYMPVDGGHTRFHSVKKGLAYVSGDALVAVHDGVRPIVNHQMLDALFSAAMESKGAFPAVSVVDTLRRVLHNNRTKVLDRAVFRLVQTPQVFRSRILFNAYRIEYSEKFTDDVSVVESRRLCRPMMVEGRRDNIKITTHADLALAEAILNQS